MSGLRPVSSPLFFGSSPVAGFSPVAFGPPSPEPNINIFKQLAKNSKSSFNRTRNSLMIHEDMFLFGRPTPAILYIMMKIYHENIIRNLCYAEHGGMSGRFTTSPGFSDAEHKSGTLSAVPEPQSFMCGLLEIDGEIYVTLAESPDIGEVEDPNFDKKQATLFALLDHCNINIEIPEGERRNINLKNNIRWRNFTNEKPNGSILTGKGDASRIMIGGDKNYDNTIWSTPLSVNFINSYDYLTKRLGGVSFPAFKKYKNNTQLIECVNGSTCCESKLFSYVYNVLGKKFEDIKGLGIFWIGNKLPPDHILKNYSYTFDNPKLDTLTSICSGILPGIPDIFKLVVQQFALPCPGCFANYSSYITGTYSMWNRSTCYKHTNARTRRAARGGGKIARNTGKKYGRTLGAVNIGKAKPVAKNAILERGKILADLRKIADDMKAHIENPSEYLLRAKKLFNALITVIHGKKKDDEIHKDLLFIAGSISVKISRLFKNKNKLKNNVNALVDLFKKTRVNDKKAADIDYTKLMDESKAISDPVVYLHNLTIEINNMNKLYISSFNKEEESTQISLVMLDLSETIQEAIYEIITGLEPKNNTGLANLFKAL
jgi:hypothetical protein